MHFENVWVTRARQPALSKSTVNEQAGPPSPFSSESTSIEGGFHSNDEATCSTGISNCTSKCSPTRCTAFGFQAVRISAAQMPDNKKANFLRFREEVSLEGISSQIPRIGNLCGGADPFRVSCPGKPKLENDGYVRIVH